MIKRLKERTEAEATEDRRNWGIYLAAHQSEMSSTQQAGPTDEALWKSL